MICPLTHPHNPLGAPENRPGKNTPQYPPGRLEPVNIFHLSEKHIQPAEEGPEEIFIIDTLLEEQADQKQMQDVLTEELFHCPKEQQETQGMNTIQGH